MRDELRCPECSSTQTRYRIKTNDHICYTCGCVFKKEESSEDSE